MATVITNDGVNKDLIPFIDVEQDGINFSGITTDTVTIGGKLSFPGSFTASGNEQLPAVNAIDIDWNNAKLGDTIIKTTGDLLSYISSKIGNPSTPESLVITFG